MNFDDLGKQHVSKRPNPSPLRNAKRSPASFDASFSQHVWPRQSRSANSGDDNNNKVNGKRPSKGFSIPLSLVKNLIIAAGVLVIGLVGTNWYSIAEYFKIDKVSVNTLSDPDDFNVMDASFDSFSPLGLNQRIDTEPDNTVESAELIDFSADEIPLNLTETFTWTEYVVKPGDSVYKIAAKFSLSPDSIIDINNLKEAWNIRVGKTLKIPNMDGVFYKVAKNDSISKIAVKMKVPQNAILDANNLLSDTIRPDDMLFIPGVKMNVNDFNRAVTKGEAPRKAPVKPLIFPVSGRITSGYGWREDPVNPRPGDMRFHKAVDISGKTGDPIKAAMKGTVLRLDNNPNLGNFIVLGHGEYQTLYAHLSAYSVKAGDKVEQGQEIGKVGETGYTTGPHLHFEAFRNGNRINPLDLIK